jgi:hypothetical protein
MIAKLEVRRMLVSYENKLREEIKGIREKLEAMENACPTLEIERIWRRSEEYAELHTKLTTLSGVLSDIIDMRYSKILDDDYQEAD